jgi:hypothetical protein
MQTSKIVTIVLAVLAIIAIGYLIMDYNSGSTMPMKGQMAPPMMNHMMNYEGFVDNAPAGQVSVSSGMVPSQMAVSQNSGVDASESIQYVEQPQSLSQMDSGTGSQMNQLPSECYPKDVLSSADLLPRDANSLWAQVSPSGQGSLADQNFLTSGFHIGINTVGQTLRNANRQLRSEPLNPQVKVSPWQQTTIEPDINRRPLEIASGDL